MEERNFWKKPGLDTFSRDADILRDVGNLLADHQRALSDMASKNDARRLRLEALKTRQKQTIEKPLAESTLSTPNPTPIPIS